MALPGKQINVTSLNKDHRATVFLKNGNSGAAAGKEERAMET